MFFISLRIHIRRTDKINVWDYVNISYYMEAVDEWYDLHEKCSEKVPRKIFLASDDPDVVRNIKERYDFNSLYYFLKKKEICPKVYINLGHAVLCML